MPAVITFCVETGLYEAYAVVLARSIRRFGGALNGFRCIAVAPREKFYPSQATQEMLTDLGVEVETTDINREFPDYPLANKPLALVYSQSFGESTLWLDTDTIVVGDPTSLLDEHADVMVCPVFGKGVGSTGEGDSNDAYWQHLYKICGVRKSTFCETVLSGVTIRSYFNTGVIFSKNRSGLFDQWYANMTSVLRSDILPPNGSKYMIEQSVFAATVEAMQLKLLPLPISCNYPVHVTDNVVARHGVSRHDAKIWHHTNRFSDAFSRLARVAFTKGWSYPLIDLFLDRLLENPALAVNRQPHILTRVFKKAKRSLIGWTTSSN